MISNSQLNILFIARSTLNKVSGGDTIQIQNTAQKLSELGVSVDIKLSNDNSIEYSKYSLIHFFNVIRPADILIHIRKSKLPYVVSTIYVDYSDYESKNSNNFRDKILSFFDSDFREYLKVIARWVVNGEKIASKQYLLLGHKKSIKKVIKNASLLLPNSKSEYERLVEKYGVENKMVVIPNAADIELFNLNCEQELTRDNKIVLCVARIEGRKNQLNLIKALNGTEFKLYIIGKPAPNHIEYYNNCKSIAQDNIYFIEELCHKELLKYYLMAKVHILPSWFETTGLSSLEALFCGCNIIVTEYGDTKDYFPENFVEYCNPDSVNSIYESVCKASIKRVDIEFIESMKQLYNWKNTSSKTLEAYKQVIGVK